MKDNILKLMKMLINEYYINTWLHEMENLKVNIKSYAKYTYLMIMHLSFKMKVLIFRSLETQEFSVKGEWL